MRGEHKVTWLCEALLVSTSGYYDWRRRGREPGVRQQENAVLCERIHEVFAQSRGTYGSPRITVALDGAAGRHRVARLMRQEQLRARQRSKYRVATTDSRHDDPIAPNRLLEVEVRQPDQVWVTDATCVLTGQGWLYLVALLDLHSRRIVGWSMGEHLDAPLVMAALQMAIAQRQPTTALIVHSDRGTQFASGAYRQLLADHGLLASMSRRANCYDNAFIESFWSSLKYEAIYPRRFATRAEARSAIFDYIECFYNRLRLHSSIGYVSPVTFESKLN